MKKLKQLIQDHAEWSQKTFGLDSEKGPIGPLQHLEKEAKEAYENPTDKIEYADCFLLVLDSIRRAGISFEELVELSKQKLEICKKRTWKKVNGAEYCVHEKESKND